MRHFLIDTNVLLDFLSDRKPFSDQAEVLFEYKHQKKIEIYVSAISFNNLYYIINKISGHKKAIKLLSELADLVIIVSLDNSIIRNSLLNNFSDYEDAIQYNSALSVRVIEGIITRNNKDFKKSELPILSSEIAIKLADAK